MRVGVSFIVVSHLIVDVIIDGGDPRHDDAVGYYNDIE